MGVVAASTILDSFSSKRAGFVRDGGGGAGIGFFGSFGVASHSGIVVVGLCVGLGEPEGGAVVVVEVGAAQAVTPGRPDVTSAETQAAVAKTMARLFDRFIGVPSRKGPMPFRRRDPA